jgi:hypothetical protein
MVVYTCNLCNKKFTLKGDYTRHINKKFACNKEALCTYNIITQNTSNITQNTSNITQNTSNITQNTSNVQQRPNIDENIDINNLECKYCNKKYSRIDNLHRHEKEYCKIKIQMEIDDKKKEKLYELLVQEREEIKKEREKMKKEIEETNKKIETLQKQLLKSNSKMISVRNNNSNNTINIHNNNILNLMYPFDKIDESVIRSRMTMDEKREMLLNNDTYINMIQKIYFNDNHPELQSAYIDNKKMMFVMILKEDGKFDLCDWNYVINKMNRIIPDTFNNIQKDVGRNIDIKTIKSNEKLMNEVVNTINIREGKLMETTRKCIRFVNTPADLPKTTNDGKHVKLANDVVMRVKSILYNNKDKIKSTYNKMMANGPLNDIVAEKIGYIGEIISEDDIDEDDDIEAINNIDDNSHLILDQVDKNKIIGYIKDGKEYYYDDNGDLDRIIAKEEAKCLEQIRAREIEKWSKQ